MHRSGGGGRRLAPVAAGGPVQRADGPAQSGRHSAAGPQGGLKRLTQREQTYLLYRYGFTDGEEHPLIGAAIYFHLTKGRAKKTEEQAMDNLWLELPWWFI